MEVKRSDSNPELVSAMLKDFCRTCLDDTVMPQLAILDALTDADEWLKEWERLVTKGLLASGPLAVPSPLSTIEDVKLKFDKNSRKLVQVKSEVKAEDHPEGSVALAAGAVGVEEKDTCSKAVATLADIYTTIDKEAEVLGERGTISISLVAQ